MILGVLGFLLLLLIGLNIMAARRNADYSLAVHAAVMDGAALLLTAAFMSLFEITWYDKALNFGIALAAEGFLALWLLRRMNRKRALALLLTFVLLVGGRAGTGWYAAYTDSIRVPEKFNVYTYSPFRENSLAKTLPEPSALRLTGDPPRMDGATALYPVYAAFAKATFPDAFSDGTRDDGHLYLDCSTTAWAYRNIVDGSADIIFVAGPSEEQKQYARDKGVELVYTPIGKEAFVFFVNPANPIDSLTVSQIQDIYSGKTTRWDQLGVPGLGGIRAFQRSEGSGSQTALLRLMGNTPLMEAPRENQMGGMLAIVEATADYKNFKNALGYSFRFYCTELVKDFDVKLLALNGVPPTRETIENGTYPMASYFYAVTRSDADENTKALLDWICGPQGQWLIDQTGYTPLSGGKGEEP